ncbi:hypothetical protein H2200_005251 [Cladophialophora chaetospira]|uniref:Uncharacterized protein n=1 Tax=Cladophialophora chaetospira TaxID=386627 RepID=A0AA38XCA2_9EURO|nr:hypothetical protein H2200_005251 [Cladophialophora chaetospira]
MPFPWRSRMPGTTPKNENAASLGKRARKDVLKQRKDDNKYRDDDADWSAGPDPISPDEDDGKDEQYFRLPGDRDIWRWLWWAEGGNRLGRQAGDDKDRHVSKAGEIEGAVEREVEGESDGTAAGEPEEQ